MPTPTKGPRLGSGPQHEQLLLANLATALFEHDRITTTHAKAKALRPLAEKLITFAKRGDIHARRQVLTVVRNKTVVHRLFEEIGPRYVERLGGYTRITKIGPRKGDNAPMAVIELVESRTIAQEAVGEAEKARGTRFARRRGAAGPADVPGAAAAAETDTEPDTETISVEAAPEAADTAEAATAEVATETAETTESAEGAETAAAETAEAAAPETAEAPATDAADVTDSSDDSGAGNQAESASETSQAEGEAEQPPA